MVLKKTELERLRKELEKNKSNMILNRMLNKVALVDLVTDKGTFLDDDFNINIKTHGITDQEYSGRCWSFSGLNLLREKVIKECSLPKFELSGSYIAFYDKLERFNKKMDNLIKYKKEGRTLYDLYVSELLYEGIFDGGWPGNQFAELVNKYGVVPSKVFPESYQSSNTSEINLILSRLLSKFYLELEKCPYGEERKVRNKFFKYAYKIITSVYGIPPEVFDFEYTNEMGRYNIDRNLTPKEFYDKYIGIDLLNDYVEIGSYKDDFYNYNNVYEFEDTSQISGADDLRVLNLKREAIKRLVLKQLEHDEPVRFASSTTYDRIDGIWIDTLERYGDIFRIDLTMDGNDIIKTNGRTGQHAMLFTGVKTIDGKPVKWKIENSWGKDCGNDGYYIATDDWFDKYVHSVLINKKYLTKPQKKVLEKEVIKVNKWDAKLD